MLMPSGVHSATFPLNQQFFDLASCSGLWHLPTAWCLTRRVVTHSFPKASPSHCDELWWRERVCVVGDPKWSAERVLCFGRDTGACVEVVDWQSAPRVSGPLGALVVILNDAHEGSMEQFEFWASIAWQPCTVLANRTSMGSTQLQAHLRRLGFGPSLPFVKEPPWQALGQVVASVLSENAWLVAWFVRSLGVTAPKFVEVASAALRGPRPATSVKEWGQRLGLVRWELRRLLRAFGAPPAQRLLPRMLLWRACVVSRTSPVRLTRDKVARAVGYCSGDYLGRIAKEVSGLSFGALARSDLRAVVDCLATMRHVGR